MKKSYTTSLEYRGTEFLRSISRTATKNTHQRYCFAMDNFFGHFRNRQAEDIHRWDINDYKEERLHEGMAPSSVNLELAIIRSFYNWMLEREYVEINPASKVKRAKVPERKPKGLSRAQVEGLLAQCHSTRDKLIILLPLTTGMRGIELARLQWSDIDWEQNRIVLNGERTKTGRSRTLPLRADVIGLLREFLTLMDNRPEEAALEVFSTKDVRNTRAWFTRICRRAGLVPCPGLHSLRHTFASTLLRHGVDVYTVKELLGHSKLETTAWYLCAADKAEVCKQLDVFPGLP